MRRLGGALIALTVLSPVSNAQTTGRAALPARADVERALTARELKSEVRALRDAEVVTAIRSDLARNRTKSSVNQPLPVFESNVRDRLILHRFASGAIPVDALRDVVPQVTLSDLQRASVAPVIDRNLASTLVRHFGEPRPASLNISERYLIVNPNAPRDDAPPAITPGGPSRPGLDDTNRRFTEVWRQGFSYVVALAAPAATGAQIFCTGAIVGERLIITAAHCLLDSRSKLRDPASFGAYVAFQNGTDVVKGLGGGESRNMKKLSIADTVWIGGTAAQFPNSEATMDEEMMKGNDVALLVLKDKIAMNQLAHRLEIAEAGSVIPPITVAGYGPTNAKTQVGDSLLEIGTRTGKFDIKSNIMATFPPDPDKKDVRACPSDSGAPVLAGSLTGALDETHRLIALVSAGAGRFDGGTKVCFDGHQLMTLLNRKHVVDWYTKVAAATSTPVAMARRERPARHFVQ